MDFASHLKALRQRAGHTQRSLAEAAGLPGRTVEKWEIGQLPSILVLRSLAKVLGVSLDELIPEDDSHAEELAKKSPKRSLAPAAKRRRSGTPSSLRALDAAAKVLGESGKALSCRELVQAMAAKGYWKSPGGRTPWATLSASILKEIARKGRRARFKKTARGRFVLR